MSDAPSRILIVVGRDDGADFVARALAHPSVQLTVFSTDEFVAALSASAFEFAIVGGSVGSRGALVLCEAVRMSQAIPVVVLVDANVNPKALEQHRKLAVKNVQYFDFQRWRDPAGSLSGVGLDLRQGIFTAVGRTEDPAALSEAQGALQKADAAREARRAAEAQAKEAKEAKEAPSPADAAPEVVELVDIDDDAAMRRPTGKLDEPMSEAAPPFLTQLTQDDVEFAGRIVDRTKSIDFRTAVPAMRPGLDSADAKTVQLRDKLRDLERQMARLAFVYKTRKKKFDDADGAIAQLHDGRQKADALINQLRAQVQGLEQQHNENSQQRERNFGNVLNQAEQAFGQLRDQSSKALELAGQQVQQKTREVEAANAQIDQLRRQLELALQAQSASQSQREDMLQTSMERERGATDHLAAAEQRLVDEKEARLAERAELSSQIEALTTNCMTYASKLEAAQRDISELQAQLEAQASNVIQLEAQVAHEQVNVVKAREEAERTWSEKAEKLKESASVFRDAYQEHEQSVKDLEGKIALLEEKVSDRDRVISSIEKSGAQRGADPALEGRLDGLERSLSSTAEQLVNGLEELKRQAAQAPAGGNGEGGGVAVADSSRLEAALKDLKQQITRQEIALETLAASPSGRRSTGIIPKDVPALQWLAASTPRALAAAGGLVLVTALAVAVIMPRKVVVAASDVEDEVVEDGEAADADSEGAEPAVPVAKPAVAAAAVAADDGEAEPAVEAPAADAKADGKGEEAEDEGEEGGGEAVAGAPAPAPGGGSEEERKELRKKLFTALGKKKWSDAASAAEALRNGHTLDWECAFKVGEALEKAGKLDTAVAAYVDFTNGFSDNAFVDDALFRAGAIRMKQGKKDEARGMLQQVADRKGNLAAKAKLMLKKLK